MDDCDKLRSENIVFAAMRLQVERNGELLWQKEVDFPLLAGMRCEGVG